jgi:hypothetical protein
MNQSSQLTNEPLVNSAPLNVDIERAIAPARSPE